jgi:Xaa-Pro aminopeptidase
VYISPEQVSVSLQEAVPDSCTIREGRNFTTDMKAVKNETEIGRLRNALLKDSRALLRFHMRLEEQLRANGITETEAAAALTEFRSREELFVQESFPPIVAYADHGAIVHYRATAGSEHRIGRDGLLLIDSGAHYLDGTSDITRVFCFQDPEQQQERRDYTLVLKGHIALAEARFPAGTTGHQLDTLARSPLWEAGINYGHGTGHGIGFFLNVHEGPQRISRHSSATAMRPGMITSNEPGIYREGCYGIRLENLILTVEKEDTAFGSFLSFETLSFYPFEPLLIDTTLLSEREVRWLNHYHSEVYRRLSPLLSENERQWLEKKTAVLK